MAVRRPQRKGIHPSETLTHYTRSASQHHRITDPPTDRPTNRSSDKNSNGAHERIKPQKNMYCFKNLFWKLDFFCVSRRMDTL